MQTKLIKHLNRFGLWNWSSPRQKKQKFKNVLTKIPDIVNKTQEQHTLSTKNKMQIQRICKSIETGRRRFWNQFCRCFGSKKAYQSYKISKIILNQNGRKMFDWNETKHKQSRKVVQVGKEKT